MRKLSPKQKASFRAVLDELVAESVARARRREEFLAKMQVLLDSLDGTQKYWLFCALQQERWGYGVRAPEREKL